MSKLTIDPDEMTLGDLEDFQEQTGMSFEKAFEPKFVKDEDGNKTFDPKGRPLKAMDITPTVLKVLVWIDQRRDNPAFTLEDARAIKIRELVIGSTLPDPTMPDDVKETAVS